jgi:hypothetical protein
MVVPTATEASACRVAAATGTGPDARGTAVGKAAEGAATADDAAEGAATADDAAEGAATADDAAEGEAGEGVVAPGRECGPLAVHAETASSTTVAAPAVQTRARFMRVRRRRRG